jgi:chromosome segregation ATPase
MEREALEGARGAAMSSEERLEASEARAADLAAALERYSVVAHKGVEEAKASGEEREGRLKAQAESLRMALVDTERGAGEAMARAEVAEEEAGELRVRVEKLAGALDHVSSVMEATLAEKEAVERRCEELKGECAQMREEVAALQEELEEAREEAKWAHAALEDRGGNI